MLEEYSRIECSIIQWWCEKIFERSLFDLVRNSTKHNYMKCYSNTFWESVYLLDLLDRISTWSLLGYIIQWICVDQSIPILYAGSVWYFMDSWKFVCNKYDDNNYRNQCLYTVTYSWKLKHCGINQGNHTPIWIKGSHKQVIYKYHIIAEKIFIG